MRIRIRRAKLPSITLEPQDPIGKNRGCGERLPQSFGNCTEIFSDDHARMPLALDRRYRDERIGRELHIGTRTSGRAFRNPELARVAENVIDSECARMA